MEEKNARFGRFDLNKDLIFKMNILVVQNYSQTAVTVEAKSILK